MFIVTSQTFRRHLNVRTYPLTRVNKDIKQEKAKSKMSRVDFHGSNRKQSSLEGEMEIEKDIHECRYKLGSVAKFSCPKVERLR